MENVVRLSPGKRADQNALEVLASLLQTEMLGVNEAILSGMQSHVHLIPELSGHLINSGGKRIRPLLTIASAHLCGYHGGREINLAAAIEFVHTATLLHDDVVDESDLRRGKATANTVWGNQASVLVGDYLFSRSFQMIAKDGSMEVVEVMANTSTALSEGEVLQLSAANNVDTSEETYLKVIDAKTAALFAAATRIGGIVAVASDSEKDALESYGRNLGVAFQLVDDALDYSATQATLGKAVGDDFREGKITLPAILAYRRGSEDDRAFWKRTLSDLDQQDDDLEKAIMLMTDQGTLADTIGRAQHYGSVAKDAVGIFPDGELRQALVGVVDFCVNRAY